MHWIDWSVLLFTILFITLYGVWKTRGNKSAGDYLNAGKNTPWWAIGLSIMATQASAITFISTPGLGYSSGLGFVQFYFGLPIAMIIIARFFVPVYHRLNVFTAYEFLEKRFDAKTRLLAAFLFLVQRGLAAGITIYAPSIILAKILGWNLYVNIFVIGILVIIYTVSGGTAAVTQTHKQQMAVIFGGLFIAFGFLIYYITRDITFSQALDIAAINGRLDALDFKFDLETRYNVWSGVIGGTFLMLSYFGTDQSQVQRYLSGKNVKEIKTGLYFNAVMKIPMQLFILFIGAMVFVFYQLHTPPLHFDQLAIEHLENSTEVNTLHALQAEQDVLAAERRSLITESQDLYEEKRLELDNKQAELKASLTTILEQTSYTGKVKKESDFVFITYVLDYLPIGLIGLIMAVLFSAAMSSTSAELNALGSTTLVDFYKRKNLDAEDDTLLKKGKLYTALWGVLAIVFAITVDFMENLVEAVNILGSLFYGTILGVFIVAFFMKRIGGKAVFWSAIVAELTVICFFLFDEQLDAFLGWKVEYLWYNLIGCLLVMLLSWLMQQLFRGTIGEISET
jgi:Na+/proline symporter